MVSSAWFRLAALGSLFLFTSLIRGLPGLMVVSSLWLAGISFLGVIGILVYGRVTRDKYDLRVLTELVQEGTYNKEDVLADDVTADNYCVRCDLVYGAQFGVCPRCGSR